MEILNNIGLINVAQKCYAENHRFYHNWSHITQMMATAKEHDVKLDMTSQVALLFHDAVYVPLNPENEISSAYLMLHYVNSFDFGLPEDFDAGKAFDLIVNTKASDPELFKHKEESSVIHDLDYFYFAMPYNIFRLIRDNIRSEHSSINDSLFNGGSIQFFETLKSQGDIFLTEKFKQYNSKALENIEREIKHLKSAL